MPIEGRESKFIRIDILNKSDFNKIRINFDIVINLTGQITNPLDLCFKLNSTGIKNIIDFVKDHRSKLIQISTVLVHGSSKTIINTESSVRPETPYSSYKAMAEFLIEGLLEPAQFSILRLSNLYGEGQQKGMLSYLLKSIRENDEVFFNNDGTLIRHFLHVDDAAKLITNMVIDFKKGIYIYSGSEAYSIKDLISILEEISHNSISVKYSKIKPWENISEIDSSNAIKSFGVEKRYSLPEWFKKQINK
jgi:nucleoside-diphosphate-sugar epimerase